MMKPKLRMVQLPVTSHDYLKAQAKEYGLTLPQMLATMLDVAAKCSDKITEVLELRKPEHAKHREIVIQKKQNAVKLARDQRVKDKEELQSLRTLLSKHQAV